MNDKQMVDPVVELLAVQRELSTLRGQLKELQVERDRLRLGYELAGHLARHLQADAALEIAQTLARRAKRTQSGRLRVDGERGGLLANDPAELAKQYLDGPGAYLRETAALVKQENGSTGPVGFDPTRIGEPEYAKRWKEADPGGFKVAWKRYLAEVAARPVGQRS